MQRICFYLEDLRHTSPPAAGTKTGDSSSNQESYHGHVSLAEHNASQVPKAASPKTGNISAPLRLIGDREKGNIKCFIAGLEVLVGRLYLAVSVSGASAAKHTDLMSLFFVFASPNLCVLILPSSTSAFGHIHIPGLRVSAMLWFDALCLVNTMQAFSYLLRVSCYSLTVILPLGFSSTRASCFSCSLLSKMFGGSSLTNSARKSGSNSATKKYFSIHTGGQQLMS